jgi:hypothetical protein
VPTVAELYQDFLDAVEEDDETALKARVFRTFDRCSRMIQPFAGVEKTWSVSVAADTETYDVSSDMSDFYLPYQGRFLKTGTTDLLANYDRLHVLKEYDYSGTGFWVTQGLSLVVRPRPAAAGTLKIDGEKRLLKMSDSAGAGIVITPEIDAELHDIYVHYAVMEYGSRDEDTEGSGSRYYVHRSKFEDAKEELERRYVERENRRALTR